MTDHELTLLWRDGRRETIPASGERTVLAAAEEAGIDLPFGCRRGACATCTGKLRDGEVTHVRPPRALKERHRAEGYVLTCVATPVSDCAIEVGPDVGTDLVSNPWK